MALPIDVTNPGLVNVANQGFDFLPRPDQPITVTPEPRDDGALISALAFAPNPPPTPFVGLPVPTQAFPANIAALPPSFALGVPAVDPPDVFVDDQVDLVILPVAEFVVTEAGSLQTNDTGDEVLIEVEVESIAPPTFPGDGFPPAFKIFVRDVGSAVPTPGVLDGRMSAVQVSMLGRQVEFTSGMNLGRTRIIQGFSGDFIVVLINELGDPTPLVAPVAGDTLEIAIDREASEVFFQFTGIPIEANPGIPSPETLPLPPPQPPTIAPNIPFAGNFEPTGGPGFIGSGDFAPPFQGTFEVARQTYGTGLPANVFVP